MDKIAKGFLMMFFLNTVNRTKYRINLNSRAVGGLTSLMTECKMILLALFKMFRQARMPFISHNRTSWSRNATMIFYIFIFTTSIFVASNKLSFAASDLPGLKIGEQDRLRVAVYQFPEASGEFTVDAIGNIYVPVAGEISAAGKRASEVSKIVATKLKERLKLVDPPSVVVDISKFRSISVLGDVQKPGEYPFTPGMMVINAITLSGGASRPADNIVRDLITSQGDLRINLRKLKENFARRARLQAEMESKLSLSFPVDLNPDSDEDKAIVQKEIQLMEVNAYELKKQIASFDELLEILNKEIVTRRAQVQAEKNNLSLMETESQNIRDLISRNIVPTSRQLPADRAVVDARRTQLELEATLLRAQQGISELNQKKVQIVSARRVSAAAEIRDLNAGAEELRRRILMNKQLVEESSNLAPQLIQPKSSSNSGNSTFTVIRREEGDIKEISAELTDVIRPGDIVNIQIRRARSEALYNQDNSLKTPMR